MITEVEFFDSATARRLARFLRRQGEQANVRRNRVLVSLPRVVLNRAYGAIGASPCHER